MKLLAVDSNSIVNRAYYGVKPLTTSDGRYTHAILGFMNIFYKIMDEVKPDEVVFTFDLKAPTFRHLKYDGYKAARKGMPNELFEQLEPLKQLLTGLGYPILTLEGYEADDLLGTLAKMCESRGDTCVIATGDRDSFQLVSDKVFVRLASTKMGQSNSQIITEEVIKEQYGIAPHQLIDVKALMGDSSDNIPGVAGIGEKTALSLIKTFGSLDEIYENIDSTNIKTAVKAKLEANKPMAYLSRELGEICCCAPIEKSIEDFAREPVNNDEVYGILSSLELRSLISRLGLAAPVKEQEQQEKPVQRQIALCFNDMQAAKRILSEKSVYLNTKYDNVPPLFALMGEKDMAVFDTDCVINLLAPNMSKIVTTGSKMLYKHFFDQGTQVDGVKFDLSLAGYILSPLAASYDIRTLALGKVLDLPNIEIDQDHENMRDFILETTYMPQLYSQMQDEIKANDQGLLLFDIEQPLAMVLASMEHLGFMLDSEGLKEYGKVIEEELSQLRERIYFLAGGEFNINSPKQLGEVLFETLGLVSKKKTKTGYSTDADVLNSIKHQHVIVEDILQYRSLSKLKSTYVDGLSSKVSQDGRLHSEFKQTETRTGRISSIEPNLQNIPIRTTLGSQLRKFFVAKEGCVLVDADYSQIELRVLAHIADDETMQKAFESGEDIHTKTASQVFDMPEAFVTPTMRSAAKAVNFGIVYGIGAFSLSKDIGVTVDVADKYIKNYLRTYSGVKEYMDKTIAEATEKGYVTTLFGRRRPIPELSATNKMTKAFGERIAMNTPIQGTAADIIKIAMVKIYNRLKSENLQARLILQIHDELIVESPEEEAQRVQQLLSEEMVNAVSLKVAMKADAAFAKNWLDAK